METFASRTKNRRTELGLTQGEVATRSGLKQPDISKIERGLILQTTELLGLAKALQCSPYWLESGQGDVVASAQDSMPSMDDDTRLKIAQIAVVLQAIPKEARERAYFQAIQALIGHLSPSPSSTKPQLVGPGTPVRPGA